MTLPLELELKMNLIQRKWERSTDSQRLHMLINLLAENFVLHSELTRRDRERKEAKNLLIEELFSAPKSKSVNLPPVPPAEPRPEPRKELPIGFCFDLWLLTVAVWWGKRQ